MTYVPTGPFTDGAAPGISSEFLNAVENWIIGADNSSPHVLNGSTSGTATLYQVLAGNVFKLIIINLNNFWNNGGSTQTIAFPTAFTAACGIRTSGLYQVELRVGGTAQSISIITALAAAGGSTTTQTNIAAYSFGKCYAAIDTIGFRSGGSAGQNGLIILEGI